MKKYELCHFCSYLRNYSSYNIEIWYGGSPDMRLSSGRMCARRAARQAAAGAAVGRPMGLFLG